MLDKVTTTQTITIAAPKIRTAIFEIVGTAPYVQHKFSQKARQNIIDTQMAGSVAKGKKKKDARKPEEDYEGATHYGVKGGCGIPAGAFRSAMISACRLVGFQMTKAKLSVFVDPDDFDVDDGTPLVTISGEREMLTSHVRIQMTTSVAFRPVWREWSAKLRVNYDADQFTEIDVLNLLSRAGAQVGIGEGRPDSKTSTGMGWGTFEVSEVREVTR